MITKTITYYSITLNDGNIEFELNIHNVIKINRLKVFYYLLRKFL